MTTLTKVIEEQEKEIASLKEELSLLNGELEARPTLLVIDALNKNVDSLKSENKVLIKDNKDLIINTGVLSDDIRLLEEMVGKEIEADPCEIHGIKDCANIKCTPEAVLLRAKLPTEVESI